MTPPLQLNNVLDGIVSSALEELERTGKPAAGELKERLRMALEDQVMIAARAMAGQNVAEAQAANAARFRALEAAGLVLSVGQAQRAIQGAILGALIGQIDCRKIGGVDYLHYTRVAFTALV